MASLKQLAQRWEALAREDALWAICADPARRNGGWSEQEFFAAGEREIETVFEHLRSLNIPINKHWPALDFGCGAGRLTRALARRFSECCGVDISPMMIEKAHGLNRDQPQCKFWLNQESHLRKFDDATFGFIYSSLVLQHINRKFLPSYLKELVRVLRPGGVVVFQVADHFNASALHKLRVGIAFRRRWNEMRDGSKATILMHCLPEKRVREILPNCDVAIKDVRITNSTDPAFNGNLEYLDREPAEGYVSKQYCVIKSA
ncbi:MAG TPA: class I SAM-dependent methyltransferase [Terriglobales bacterium]|nr:class I SAM-dependent methyltransferase [Terriglobales bacterium]